MIIWSLVFDGGMAYNDDVCKMSEDEILEAYEALKMLRKK